MHPVPVLAALEPPAPPPPELEPPIPVAPELDDVVPELSALEHARLSSRSTMAYRLQELT